MNYTLGNALFSTLINNTTLGTIGLSLTIKCIETLASTTQNIYGLITTIKTTTHHIDIKRLLVKLDMEADILLLEIMLKEIDIKKNHTQTLALGLKNLQECLNEIHKLLEIIHNRIRYNNSVWVGTTYKFDDVSEDLSNLKKVLDGRKNMLMKIIEINNILIPLPETIDVISEKNDSDYNALIITVDKILVDNNDE